MPRYFFHLYNDTVTLDNEGVELASDAEAEQRALAEARALAADSVREGGSLTLTHRIEVANAGGEKVAAVTFGDAVDIRP
jgi:hypothetical protein